MAIKSFVLLASLFVSIEWHQVHGAESNGLFAGYEPRGMDHEYFCGDKLALSIAIGSNDDEVGHGGRNLPVGLQECRAADACADLIKGYFSARENCRGGRHYVVGPLSQEFGDHSHVKAVGIFDCYIKSHKECRATPPVFEFHRWGKPRESAAITFMAVTQPKIQNLKLNPRPLFFTQDRVSFLHGVSRRASIFHSRKGRIEGPLHEPNTKSGYSYGRDAYPNKPEGIIRHILLGGQIILAASMVAGGLYLLSYALDKSRALKTGAGGGYAVIGAFGILLGVMLGAKLAFGM